MELYELTLRQAAEAIRLGEITASTYCRALLERCEAVQSLNAFISLDGERLLSEAREADRKWRGRNHLGRLHGVPIAIKDCFDVAGTPTTAGTPALRDNIPERTATVLQRLFDAGGLLLGKTNMHELAFGITSDNDFTGPVRNPYDRTMSPGGSSGGTAAAVAARTAPAGIGSDTSGSIRIPAAHCGIVGYRPSTGRYPGDGMVPMNHTRDAPGLMARSVGDIALLDEIICGEMMLHPVELQGMRVGLPRDDFFAGLDSRVAVVIDAELRRLRELGVNFIDAEPPDFAAARSKAAGPIMAWEMPRDVTRYLAEAGIGIGFEELVAAVASPYVKSELENVLRAGSAADLKSRYNRVLSDVIPRHRAQYQAYFRENNLQAIVFPTTPLAPPPLGHNDKVTVNGEQVSVWRSLRNSVTASLVGAPCLSLPAGMTEDGLPVGIEFDGLPSADRDLLSVGMAWERTSSTIPGPQI